MKDDERSKPSHRRGQARTKIPSVRLAAGAQPRVVRNQTGSSWRRGAAEVRWDNPATPARR